MTEAKVRAIFTVCSEKQKELQNQNKHDKWTITLPPDLKIYQSELESLLSKVFAHKPMLPENIALAQQMSMNWIDSKCRETGISLDETWQEVS